VAPLSVKLATAALLHFRKSRRFMADSRAENFAHASRKIFEAFGRIAPRLFGNRPAIIADLVQRFHDRGPVIVPFAERHAEAFPQSIAVSLFAAVLFNVQLLNAFAQNCNPLLGPAEVEHVTNIEMPAYCWALEIINVARGF